MVYSSTNCKDISWIMQSMQDKKKKKALNGLHGKSLCKLVALFLDCHVKPCLKQLHLTLAHKFCPHHQKTLEQLAKYINPEETCHWVAALYSRDMRFVHYQVLSLGFLNFWVCR